MTTSIYGAVDKVSKTGDTMTGTLAMNQAQINGTGALTSSTLIALMVLGDTMARYIVNANGTMGWGGGSSGTDTNLYRAAANQLQTDSVLQVNNTARVSTTLLVGATSGLGDNGVGEIQLSDAATPPSSNPTGGTVIYSASGTATPLRIRDTSGNVRSLADGCAVATANQSTTSTSQTPSTYLQLAVEANATYLMESGIVFAETGTGGVFTPSWTGPSGATLQWCDTASPGDYSSSIGSTSLSYTGSLAIRMTFLKGILITSSTAGTLTFTFATNTPFTATVYAGSYLLLRRVK